MHDRRHGWQADDNQDGKQDGMESCIPGRPAQCEAKPPMDKTCPKTRPTQEPQPVRPGARHEPGTARDEQGDTQKARWIVVGPEVGPPGHHEPDQHHRRDTQQAEPKGCLPQGTIATPPQRRGSQQEEQPLGHQLVKR